MATAKGGEESVEPRLLLGSLDAEHVSLAVSGRTHPGEADFWDGNWVRTRIEVRLGGFTADLDADLRTDEFRRFAEELAVLNDKLSGAAVLQSIEDWIELTVECDASGRLRVAGEVSDRSERPDIGSRLKFELDQFDQTYLSDWLGQLAEIDRGFPVLGHP